MAEIPDTADVLIIGAGIVGGACFHELATAGKGLRIVACEQHHKLAGSTARSAAAFRHQFSAAVNIDMSLLASRRFAEFPERMGCAPVIRRNGYCFVYRDPAALAEAALRAERQRARGVPDVLVLDAKETLARFPDVSPEGLAGSTFCPHDGFVIPDAITNAYFERGEEVGGCLKQYAPVVRITQEGGRVRGAVIAKDGVEREIRAPIVINAAGAWANLVAQSAGLDLPVVPVKRYLYFTKQFRERDVRSLPLFVMNLEAYCRPESNGLLLGWDRKPAKPDGWRRYPPPAFPASAMDADAIEDGMGIGDYGLEVISEIADFLPFVAEETALEAVTSGYYEVSPDEKAIVGWDPRLPGLLHATGFSGHGVMHAPATGALVRALVLGETTPFDPAPLALAPLLRNEPREDPEEVVI